MARTLVTGGAGFIGSHLVEALVGAGDEVLVLDDLSTGKAENLAAVGGAVELARGDISDHGFVAARVAEFAPERAFHLAAQADVRRAVAEPTLDARINVLGTIEVLEAVRALPSCPLVFSSTGGVIYGEGDGQELPFSEDSPPAPETAYGTSKLAGEFYLDLYRRLYELPSVALRFGNVYGPRQDPHGEAGVVAIFCGRLRDGEAPTIYGDGRQTRDYVFVADVVAAALAASERLTAEPGALRNAYNIGTGVETSVLDLVAGLASASGAAIEPVHAPERVGEIFRVAIDPARANADLDWRAETGLEDGLAQSWAAVTASG